MLGLLASLSRKQKFLFFGAIAVIIIVIAAVFVVSFSKYGKEREENASHINITNFEEVANGVPEFYKVETESQIWTMLTDYNDVARNTKADAEIRNGSYTDVDRRVDFIVDIPSLEHSFQVSFTYSDVSGIPDEYDIIVNCPGVKDRIYDNGCYSYESVAGTLGNLLPTTIGEGYATIYLSISDDDVSPSLNVDFNSCAESNLDNVESAVNEWLESLGFDSGDIKLVYNPWCPITDDDMDDVEYEPDGEHTITEEDLQAMNEQKD